MVKVEKYDGTKTYMTPIGTLKTPADVRKETPAVDVFTFIVETDENSQVMKSFMNLSAVRSMYNIDSSLSEDDAITAIQTILNTPSVQEVSAEERIAAALEYQNIASMSDATTSNS